MIGMITKFFFLSFLDNIMAFQDLHSDPSSILTRNGRAYTSPWPSVNPVNRPVLKKRHSAYALSVSQSTVLPIPELPQPPVRPPRHPGRVNPFALTDINPRHDKQIIKRPSTATSPGEAAWEDLSRRPGDARSVKSQTSTLGLSTHTGPVEEVTPWELYTLPASPTSKDLRPSIIPGHLKNYKLSSTPHIPPSPHKSTRASTGPMEEVTPWELLPGPSQNDDKPVSPVSLKQSPATPLSLPRRPSNSENISIPLYPRSKATGPTEDVTPWELTPMPAEGQELEVLAHVGPLRTRSSLSLTMAQLEQVTPWELFPAPIPSGSNLSGHTQTPISTTRTSSSSNPNKTLSEVGQRPRRSTASKSSKGTRSSIPATGILNIPQLPIELTVSAGEQKGVSSNGASATQVSGSPTSASSSKQSYHDPKQPSSHNKQDLKFSTADRTILEQLKMNIRAREAQFVVKGIGNVAVGGGRSPGKKHHSYSAKEVPYPRSYEREVVDLDVWEAMFCLDVCQSLTWHVFDTPPSKVLEIGCGTGTWILHCAHDWKECHFVGLDIVPLHPDLQNVGSPDLASRITWVQHNFLDGLPFQNEEFDFVHIKRIALGVPEDKWDTFFEEIARVMKPGAAFEMVEEDLFFPGKRIDDNEGSISTDDSLSSSTRSSTSSDLRLVSVDEFPTHDDTFEEDSPETPTSSTTLLPRTPSRPNSPVHGPRIAKKENGKEVIVNEEQISYDSSPSPSIPTLSAPSTAAPMPSPTISKEPNAISPQQRSLNHPLLSVQNEQARSESGIMGTNPAGFGPSSVSLLGGTVNDLAMSRTQSSSLQTPNTTGSKAGASSLTLAALPDSELKPLTRPSPFLLRMLTQTPTNPRDHTLLETIWNEMLSSRWVNLSPLSLLTTYLEWHFKDVRTHPPLMYTFPPTAPKPELADDDVADSDSDLDVDSTPNVASLRSKRPPPIKSRNSNNPSAPSSNDEVKLTDEHRWLSLQQQPSPYVTLDETRGNAYSPAQQANIAISKAREGNTPAAKRMSRLPTTALNIDLRTLNLHLALRAKEVLACSESMWEWVEEFQRTSETSMPHLNVPNHSSMGMIRCAILEMTREDFDHLLNNFTFDFQDQAAVGHVLQERFDWHVLPSRRLQDRRAFDKACKKYDKWILAERMKSSLLSGHNPNGKINGTQNSFSTPNVDSTTHYSSPAIARSYSSPQTSFQNAKDDGTHVSSHLSEPAIRSPSLPSVSASHFTSQLTPTQRLSRSMRVFVAWKASS